MKLSLKCETVNASFLFGRIKASVEVTFPTLTLYHTELVLRLLKHYTEVRVGVGPNSKSFRVSYNYTESEFRLIIYGISV